MIGKISAREESAKLFGTAYDLFSNLALIKVIRTAVRDLLERLRHSRVSENLPRFRRSAVDQIIDRSAFIGL